MKCFHHDECENINTVCPDGLFHGPSGSMELHNAIQLFDRSVTVHGLRYKEYVADGDWQIFKNLVESIPYPGHELIKHECANHMAK